MISSEKVASLLPDHSHCVSMWHLSTHTIPGWLHDSTVPQPQLSRRFRRHRPNWHRKVNAHSMFLHSFPNRIQCKKTAEAASRNSIYWPRPEKQAGGLPALRPLEQARCPDVLTLTRMLGYGSDSEEIRLSYSSLERSSCVFNMKHFIQ